MSSENVVFISYKSDDRSLIKPYLELLEENGIQYWWDQKIDGNWGGDIEKALAKSKLVLGFVTEKSMKSGPVFAEFRRACEQDKLVPIRLDKAPITYSFETILAFLNYFDLSSDTKTADASNPEIARLISRIKNRIEETDSSHKLSERKDIKHKSHERWFDDRHRQTLFPYTLALCVFNGNMHEVVQNRSEILRRELLASGFDEEVFGLNKLSTKSKKLEEIGATIRTYDSETLPYPIEYVEFIDRDFKDEFLGFVWREMDQFKGPIIRWFDSLISSQNSDDDIKHVALAISIIGRRHFYSVYYSLILPWLRSQNSAQVDCADLALSLLNADTAIFEFVKKSINDLTEYLDNEFAFQIAMRLGCGYTGISMPDLAISLMRRVETALVENRDKMEECTRLVQGVTSNVKRLAAKANGDSYAATAAKTFVDNLAAWVSQPSDQRRSHLPCFIAVEFLSCTVPDGNSEPELALRQLLRDDSDIDSAAVESMASIFSILLSDSNSYYRNRALSILTSWCEKGANQRDKGIKHDEILELLKRLHFISKTQNDKERVAYVASKIIKF